MLALLSVQHLLERLQLLLRLRARVDCLLVAANSESSAEHAPQAQRTLARSKQKPVQMCVLAYMRLARSGTHSSCCTNALLMLYLLYLLQLCRKLCVSRVQQAHALLKQCYLRCHLRAASLGAGAGALERSCFQPQVRLKRLI